MDNEGLGSWLERRLAISPKKEALVFDNSSHSYGDLALETRKIAHGLRSLGVERSGCVAYFGFNNPAALEIMFAAGLIGATYLPLNARLTAEEASYILRDAQCTAVVFGNEQGETARTLSRMSSPVEHWLSLEHDVAWCHTYTDLVSAQPDSAIDVPVGLDELCVLMYSSGTTGSPKGVMLTHGNMMWNALNQLLSQDMTSGERVLSVAPLFHVGGLGAAVTPTLLQGGTVVMLEKFDADAVLATIESQRVTTFFAVPTMLQQLLQHPGFADADLSSLRAVSAAGSPLPLSLITPFLDRGVVITQAYGLTEAAPSVTQLSSDDVHTKLGSAGKRSFFTDVAVIRPDGSPTEAHEVGEIIAKGPNVMRGYLNLPDATDRAIVDGWLHTGDAGYFDEDGYLFVHDRYKDMYISGGENVYPAEVEAALLEFDEIEEAAVIGVPHEKWGETGMAFVIQSEGRTVDPELIRRRLRSRLAAFKIPAHIRVTDALPHTATGKIRKTRLREIAGDSSLPVGTAGIQ